jgi:opacity protein-like surface antigen
VKADGFQLARLSCTVSALVVGRERTILGLSGHFFALSAGTPVAPVLGMRRLLIVSAVALACAMPVAAGAQERKSDVHGFGGVTAGTSAFGSAVSPTFGGRVGIGLTPHVQVIGEAGRLARISSPTIRSPLLDALGLAEVGVGVSAFYGEGGIRVIASPQSAARPYGEATVGVARLNARVSGLGGQSNAIIDSAVDLVDNTRPIFGVGGGVLLRAGPASIDIGYRYKQISPGETLGALNEGKDLYVNQVRVGVGVRF